MDLFNNLTMSTGLIWKDFKTLSLVAIGLLTPIKGLILLIGMFIFIDTVLGVVAAKKQKLKITSNRLSAMLSKMAIYQFIVIVAFALDNFILGDILQIFINADVDYVMTKVATLFLLINEGFSIDEKIRIIRNGKGFWYHFKRLIGLAKLIKKETKELEIDSDDIKKVLKKDEENTPD